MKSLTIKLSISFIPVIYFLYIFRHKFFLSSPCSHLYNIHSFQRCAVLQEICNVTVLLNSYLTYRSCAIQHSSSDTNYVIFDAVNGLGNRILGLVAVTTYALVSSRVLLINWQPGDNHQAHFEDLFLPLSSMNDLSLSSKYSLSRLTNLIRNRWMNEIEWKANHSRLPRDWAFYFDREMLCNEQISQRSFIERFGFFLLNLFSSHVKWIRTDQYFVPLLTRNEKKRQAFMTLFENGQVFAELAARLLHPIAKVNKIVKDFQEQHHLENHLITIGVHMRSWSSDLIRHIEPFQKCIEHVLQNITQRVKDEKKIRLYIISNTPQRCQLLRDRLSKIYPHLEILNAPEVPRLASEVEKMQFTLAELLLLSKMSHLIITSKSTFGMIAQGLARKGAWIVRQGASHEIPKIQSDLCQWESSSEPEYQMMGSLHLNDSCYQRGADLPSIGERTIV